VGRRLIESNATRGELEDEQWGRAMRDRTLLGRFGQSEDVANVALFLASDESSGEPRATASSAVLVVGGQPVAVAEEFVMLRFAETLA
jgi:NAD(P)-dependent dehydrogenase (short-subunit alcohol dehydrogenase family)